MQLSESVLFVLQVHNEAEVVTGRADHPVLLDRCDVVVLVRRHAEVADALGVDGVHEELLFLFDFIRNKWHAYFVGTPLREAIGSRHSEREVLVIIFDEFVIDYVHKIILLDIVIVKILFVKIVVAEHDAVGFIFENHVENVVELVLPVLAELRHVQRFEVACGDVEGVQFVNIVGSIHHTQI